jgi:hypothetical protein
LQLHEPGAHAHPWSKNDIDFTAHLRLSLAHRKEVLMVMLRVLSYRCVMLLLSFIRKLLWRVMHYSQQQLADLRAMAGHHEFAAKLRRAADQLVARFAGNGAR